MTILSGLPYFFVRGAPPNNQAFFLDGVRVIHPGLVERVGFQPGAGPAQYGGYAGALIVGETKAPRPELHGEANLRLVDAGALRRATVTPGLSSASSSTRHGSTTGTTKRVQPTR